MFRLAATLFSVFLMMLAFPPGQYPYIALVAMVPFFWALMGTGPRMGLFLGFAYGFFIWLTAIWWIKIGAENWIGATPLSGGVIAMAFSFFQSLPYMIFGLVQGYFRINHSPSILKNSVLLTVCVGFFPSIFPGIIVHSFYATPLVIQMADIGGTHLLFWIILLINLLIASVLHKIYTKQRFFMPVLILLSIIGMVLCYGEYRIDEYSRLANNAPAREYIKIVAIQPNIPIKSKVDEDIFLEKSIGFTATAVDQDYADADLVVWPEVPISLPSDCEKIKTNGLADLVQSMDKPLLFECLRTDDVRSLTARREQRIDIHPDTGEKIQYEVTTYPDWGYYNIAKMISPENPCGPEYAKKILFPFGEYLPFEKQLPFLRKWLPGILHYKPGNEDRLFHLSGKNIIPSLCYEVIFSDFIRGMVGAGGNIIVNMSDDAWFGQSTAANSHLALALFRSVEYRVPLVRVTNSGFGAFVRASGEIEPGSVTPLFRTTAQAYALHVPKKKTIYFYIGDSLLYLFAFLILIEIIVCKRRQRIVFMAGNNP
jgi:apolipoprotein N-acyltransferase